MRESLRSGSPVIPIPQRGPQRGSSGARNLLLVAVSRPPCVSVASLGCLTAFGVSSRHHVVCLPKSQISSDGGFQRFQCGVGAAREVLSELSTGRRELFQRGQGVTQHGTKIKAGARLVMVERPESFDIVRIEFKELADKALGNFGGRQVHLVEGAKQSQQIEPGRFQACLRLAGMGGGERWAMAPG